MEKNNVLSSELTMSSREIAQVTGKRHDNVIRACKNLNKKYEKLGLPKVGESSYRNSQNKLQPQYLLTQIQTLDLIMGYCIELRIKVIKEWGKLEKNNSNKTERPLSRKELAQMVIDQEDRMESERKGVASEWPELNFDNCNTIESTSLINTIEP
jgi:Rha family phage regulatory protein